MKRKLVILFLLTAFLINEEVIASSKHRAEVGQTAPDFILKDIDGNTHRLSDYRGKVVMIYFAMWCGVCRANSFEIEKELYEKYHDKGLEVFAADYLNNKKEDLKPIIKDLGLRFKTLMDDGSMTKSYNGTMAMTIVIDRKGIIRYRDFYNTEKVEDVIKILLGLKKEPEKKEVAVKIPEGGISILDSERIKRRFRHSVYYGQLQSKGTGCFLPVVKLDLNNDGYDDVVYATTFDKSSKGAVFIYYGSRDGPSREPDIIIHGEQEGDSFGYSINGGDINGDGLTDLIVGAVQGISKQPGAVYIFFGSEKGISRSPSIILRGQRKGEWFGFSTAIGDINGDGYKDIAVGARLNNMAAKEAGAVYIFYGGYKGYPSEPDIIITGEKPLDYFGVSLACIDIDKDGLDDIVVAATGYNGEGVDRGAAYIFHGRKNFPSEILAKEAETTARGGEGLNVISGETEISAKEADIKIVGEKSMYVFGKVVTKLGDINSDGLDDFGIGAYDWAGETPGYVYIFLGGKQIPSNAKASDAAWVIRGGRSDTMFGCSLAGTGDIDGDGIDDFMVGSNAYKRGAVYLYLGTNDGKFISPSIVINVGNNWKFGKAVAPAGDVNGDGRMDFLVGEPWNSEKGERSGAVYLFR